MEATKPLQFCYGTPTEESVDVFVSASLNPKSITGPFSSVAKTLPSKALFAGDGPTKNARIIDPIFWSPEFPCWYELEANPALRFGIRKIECTKNSFYMNGRRRVIRAADLSNVTLDADRLQTLKDQKLEAMVSTPDATLLQRASELGVMLMVKCSHADIDRLLFWPCVAMLIPDSKTIERSDAPNHFLIQTIETPEDLATLQPWAHAVIVRDELFQSHADAIRSLGKPVMALKSHDTESNGSDPIPQRTQCDQLQAALAPDFDLPGYIV